MNNDKIYIAYGSTLNLPQMAKRCPTAKVVGKTEIKDHELLFRGSKTGSYATIEPCKGKNVPVLLWTVKPSDEIALDRYEGYPVFYDKTSATLTFDNKEVDAFVYVMTDGHSLGMPSENYVNTIMEGYKKAGFDTGILEDAINETAQRISQEHSVEQQNLFGFGSMKGW